MNLINPFHSLYVTERLSEDEFVQVVSPYLANQAGNLFAEGNTILQGTQGSGKTTLLALLKPHIREAYSRKGIEFPVPPSLRNFISVGINLTRSGILDIGKRPVLKGQQQSEENIFPLIFADFLNYHVCLDLFSFIQSAKDGHFPSFEINTERKNLELFAKSVSRLDCWHGYLEKTGSIEEIIAKIKKRLSVYRDYHQFNIDDLPDYIHKTKTSIGVPISMLASTLKSTGIIHEKTNVFVRIDQLEILLECDDIRKNIGLKYRRMINDALSKRDKSVSYKIGTRTYAWNKELRLYSQATSLEIQRDYTIADVDKTLRRNENRKDWAFPEFAKDVFARRLKYAKVIESDDNRDSREVFSEFWGPDESRTNTAKKYSSNKNARDALRIPETFQDVTVKLLESIYEQDALSAMLACAWFQQGSPPNYEKHPLPSRPYPWERTYWVKERTRQALLQLATNCQQSLLWGGSKEVINLGSAGILCFLSICQHVWDVVIRLQRPDNDSGKHLKPTRPIDIDIQTLGIISSSSLWFSKISELRGGHDRQRFIEYLGRFIRLNLLDDKSMSYPGHNGFSLIEQDLLAHPDVADFIHEAVDYGVLVEVTHTSKKRNDPPRVKWYPNPIYCPHLKIYEARIKEPLYTKIDEVIDWIKCTRDVADGFRRNESKKSKNPSLNTPTLFD